MNSIEKIKFLMAIKSRGNLARIATEEGVFLYKPQFFAEDEEDYAYMCDKFSDDGKLTPLGGVILEGSYMNSIEEVPKASTEAAA